MNNWDKYAKARHLGRNRLIFFHHEEVMRDFIDYWSTTNTELSIIDIGCSEGLFLNLLRELGFSKLFGIDAAKQNVEVVKRKGIDAEIGDLVDEQFLINNKRRSNVVLLMDVLEHLQDPTSALLNIKKYFLDNKGILYLTIPIYDSIYHNYIRFRENKSRLDQSQEHDSTHLWAFSEKELFEILNASGFNIIESKRLSCPIPFFGRNKYMKRLMQYMLPIKCKGMFYRIVAESKC